jgi:putative transposase
MSVGRGLPKVPSGEGRMEWQDEGRLRFSIIGALLAAPPAKGALRPALQQLAARQWRHPSTGAPVRFSVSTLERWFYRSRNEQHDPVSVLRRKRRGDAGAQVSMTTPLRQALRAQYNAHKSWSAQLHHANLVALAETRSELRPVPSYATVRRFLAAHGLTKRRPMTRRQTDGALAAAARLEAREVRSYESEYSGGLWHWDCHVGSRKVLTPRGEWRTPVLFGVLDDHSRLVCHLQWYLSESAENIAHGPVAGDAKARPGACCHERQRRCHDRHRDHRRSCPARHSSPHDAAIFPIRQR